MVYLCASNAMDSALSSSRGGVDCPPAQLARPCRRFFSLKENEFREGGPERIRPPLGVVSRFGWRGFGTRVRLEAWSWSRAALLAQLGSGDRGPGRKQGHTLFSFFLFYLFPAGWLLEEARATPFRISIDLGGEGAWRGVASLSPALHCEWLSATAATGTHAGVYLPGEFIWRKWKKCLVFFSFSGSI